MIWLIKHWKKILLGFGALAVVLTIFAGYRFVSNLVHQNELLAGRVGQLETAKAVQDVTIEAQQRAIEEWARQRDALALQLQELSDVRIEARAERERLLEDFAMSDLAEELAADPDLVQARINSDLARARCLLAARTGNDDCRGGDRDREALAPTIAETGTD